MIFSEESRRKMSESHKGKKLPPEQVKKMVESRRGYRHSEKTIKKMSDTKKGHKVSRETREKISKTKKGNCGGQKHPLFGTHPSEATKKKLRDSHLGKHLPEEQRRKIGQSNIGHRALSGENAPGWKGGISFEPYCPRFNNKFKERVRAFFGYQCVECGTPQINRKMHVHHVNFRKDACCIESVIPLFVSLCDSCHAKSGYDREYWQEHFTEIINTYYGGKCYFTVEEMSQLQLAIRGESKFLSTA